MIMLRMIIFIDESEPFPEKKVLTKKAIELKDTTEKILVPKKGILEQSLNKNIEQDWLSTINKLSLSGLALHLAKHSVFDTENQSSPVLYVNEDKKDIYPKLCINDLLGKIKDHYGLTVDIGIEYKKDLSTPIVIESLQNESELNERYEKVKDDPDITKLQKLFGANINKESIKKIIE
jgi:hypothetical protein